MFLGRFSKLWSKTHNDEVNNSGSEIDRFNSGSMWIRAVTKTIWEYVYEMWKERNLDRHGRDNEEIVRKVRQQNLQELETWYERRDNKRLELVGSEANVFYSTIQEHKQKEGEPALVEKWLCAYRPVLLQSKLRATEARREVAGSRRNEGLR